MLSVHSLGRSENTMNIPGEFRCVRPGILAWLFGITDRSIASFSDGYLSAIDLTQLFTASFFLVSWLYLKPQSFNPDSINN